MPSVVERLRAIVAPLPTGAAVTLPADVVREWCAAEPCGPVPAPVALAEPLGWRERLWTCSPDARLGVKELAEAVGRSADWVYRATNAARATEHGRDPLPCAKLDGVLTFAAGAVRGWLRASEIIVNPETAARRISRTRRTP